MIIKWIDRECLNDFKARIKVSKYYAHIDTHYRSFEQRYDRGTYFYGSAVNKKEVIVEINEKVYNKLLKALSSDKPVVYKVSNIQGYEDVFKKVSTEQVEEDVSLLEAVEHLIKMENYRLAVIWLKEARKTISKQFAEYNSIYKDEFIDKWNKGVQDDLNTIDSKIEAIHQIEKGQNKLQEVI